MPPSARSITGCPRGWPYRPDRWSPAHWGLGLSSGSYGRPTDSPAPMSLTRNCVPVREVLPVPPLAAPLRQLIEWCADYYVAPLAAVARMALSSGGALKGAATTIEYRLTGGLPERMTPQRQAALEALEHEQATIRELAGIAGVSEGVLAWARQPGRARTGRGRLRSTLPRGAPGFRGSRLDPRPTGGGRPVSERRSVMPTSRHSCSTG